jgi:hypothetical protein
VQLAGTCLIREPNACITAFVLHSVQRLRVPRLMKRGEDCFRGSGESVLADTLVLLREITVTE